MALLNHGTSLSVHLGYRRHAACQNIAAMPERQAPMFTRSLLGGGRDPSKTRTTAGPHAAVIFRRQIDVVVVDDTIDAQPRLQPVPTLDTAFTRCTAWRTSKKSYSCRQLSADALRTSSSLIGAEPLTETSE